MQLILRFLATYAKRYTPWYLLGLACLVATNWLTVSIPGFVQEAVDALRDGDGADGAVPWAWAILAAGAGVIVVRTLSRTLFFNPGRTIEFRVKNSLFERLLALPQAYFDRMRPGDLISRGTNDTNGVRALAGFSSLQLFNTALVLVLTVGKMLSVEWRLTLICLGPLIVAVLVLRYAVRAMFSLSFEFQAHLGTLSDRILETYGGVGVLQAYGGLSGAHARFDVANDRLLDLALGLVRIRSWLLPVVSVVGNLCVVLVLWMGAGMVGDSLTLGELASFTVYVSVLVGGLTNVGWLVNSVQRGYIALERVYEVLDAPTERTEPEGALPEAPAAGRGLEVRDLTFTYPQRLDGREDLAPEPVLRDVSFRVIPGETLGVFGPTGSGKSTLLDLLARVHEPPRGTVLTDGVDVCDVPVRAYWQDVAYVLQEPFLFSQTVRENIAAGVPSDGIDDGRVDAAVRDAALDQDLTSMPDGLRTVVGERGVTLSGGQRQRTALARALYRDFRVLLLDDVMSAVDHATEKRLIDALYRRAAAATTVLVSHRVSVLAKADRVLVLDGGRVVDVGTHEQLLAKGEGPYFRAHALQQAADAMAALDAQSSADGEGADG